MNTSHLGNIRLSRLALTVIQRAKDFIGAVDLVAGIAGNFAQHAGLDKFLNILSGSLERHIHAFRELFCGKDGACEEGIQHRTHALRIAV